MAFIPKELGQSKPSVRPNWIEPTLDSEAYNPQTGLSYNLGEGVGVLLDKTGNVLGDTLNGIGRLSTNVVRGIQGFPELEEPKEVAPTIDQTRYSPKTTKTGSTRFRDINGNLDTSNISVPEIGVYNSDGTRMAPTSRSLYYDDYDQFRGGNTAGNGEDYMRMLEQEQKNRIHDAQMAALRRGESLPGSMTEGGTRLNTPVVAMGLPGSSPFTASKLDERNELANGRGLAANKAMKLAMNPTANAMELAQYKAQQDHMQNMEDNASNMFQEMRKQQLMSQREREKAELKFKSDVALKGLPSYSDLNSANRLQYDAGNDRINRQSAASNALMRAMSSGQDLSTFMPMIAQYPELVSYAIQAQPDLAGQWGSKAQQIAAVQGIK